MLLTDIDASRVEFTATNSSARPCKSATCMSLPQKGLRQKQK